MLKLINQNQNHKLIQMNYNSDYDNSKAYFVKGILGYNDLENYPTMHFSLLIEPHTNLVSGSITISNVDIENQDFIVVSKVTGMVNTTNNNIILQLISIKGEYILDADHKNETPNLKYFEAFLAVDELWSGVGNFTYENINIENLPIQISTICNKEVIDKVNSSEVSKYGYQSKQNYNN